MSASCVRVQVEGPDEQGRFLCFVDGWMERWDLDRIMEAIADGADVGEWE